MYRETCATVLSNGTLLFKGFMLSRLALVVVTQVTLLYLVHWSMEDISIVSRGDCEAHHQSHPNVPLEGCDGPELETNASLAWSQLLIFTVIYHVVLKDARESQAQVSFVIMLYERFLSRAATERTYQRLGLYFGTHLSLLIPLFQSTVAGLTLYYSAEIIANTQTVNDVLQNGVALVLITEIDDFFGMIFGIDSMKSQGANTKDLDKVQTGLMMMDIQMRKQGDEAIRYVKNLFRGPHTKLRPEYDSVMQDLIQSGASRQLIGRMHSRLQLVSGAAVRSRGSETESDSLISTHVTLEEDDPEFQIFQLDRNLQGGFKSYNSSIARAQTLRSAELKGRRVGFDPTSDWSHRIASLALTSSIVVFNLVILGIKLFCLVGVHVIFWSAHGLYNDRDSPYGAENGRNNILHFVYAIAIILPHAILSNPKFWTAFPGIGPSNSRLEKSWGNAFYSIRADIAANVATIWNPSQPATANKTSVVPMQSDASDTQEDPTTVLERENDIIIVVPNISESSTIMIGQDGGFQMPEPFRLYRTSLQAVSTVLGEEMDSAQNLKPIPENEVKLPLKLTGTRLRPLFSIPDEDGETWAYEMPASSGSKEHCEQVDVSRMVKVQQISEHDQDHGTVLIPYPVKMQSAQYDSKLVWTLGAKTRKRILQTFASSRK